MPDGYTMVVTNGPLFSLTPKYIDVSYELSNFTMLRGMRQVALMIFTNPQKSGKKTFDDLINYGKTHKITYATSSGPGGDQYVVSSAMFKALGIEAEPVVMGSEAESINAVGFRSGRLRSGVRLRHTTRIRKRVRSRRLQLSIRKRFRLRTVK